MRTLWLLIGSVFILLGSIRNATAQSPQFVPAYPLYCQGPISTSVSVNGETTTPFIWASSGAGAANPEPGQCTWADRAARDVEILSGGGNVICDFSSAMQSVPAGTFVEIGVARDPLVNNCMHLARYIGTVSPPFSAIPALPPFTRQSIATLTPAQITSLQHGIQVMMSRPASDPTSFQFQANIHGTYSSATTPQEILSWNNCEHGSYYFLSWHRMYLYFFDRILRAASADPTLVLPYWNWTDPAQRTLPLPFRQPANASNSLYVAPPNRPAALDAGTAGLGAGTVDYTTAFNDTNFDSPAGSGASFGGQIASATQFNAPHGEFEGQPHDVVHVALGGLMGDPDTAAQDPIFWLHHANIDRMWNRWIAQGSGRADATDAAWLNTRFTFYDEAGHAVYLTGAEIIESVGQLNYRYDDDPLRFHLPILHTPLRPIIEASIAKVSETTKANDVHRINMTTIAVSEKTKEAGSTELNGATVHLRIPLTNMTTKKILTLVPNQASRRVFVRFNDIQYKSSSGVYYEIYVNPPTAQELNIYSPNYVGNLALFGLKPHAMHGHMSMNTRAYAEYDISHLVRWVLTENPKEISIVLIPRGLFDATTGEPLPVSGELQGVFTNVSIVGR